MNAQGVTRPSEWWVESAHPFHKLKKSQSTFRPPSWLKMTQ